MIGRTNVGGGAGGAGGGATLVISSPANVSVTVSKDDKSYSKNSGSLGSTTFKGLATGTWTVTISGNGQTATRTIEITADYAITIAFFSATINITYPANSNCVVTNSGGQTVASDTNSTSSEKTFTATVNATGTYSVTATATDGSGNTRFKSVEITSEGQSVGVELSYHLYLIKNGVVLSPFVLKSKNFTIGSLQGSSSVNGNVATLFQGTVVYFDPFDISKYTSLTVELETSDVVQWINFGLDATIDYFRNNLENSGMAAVLNIPGGVKLSRETYTLDISKVEGTEFYITFYSWMTNQAQLIIQNLYFN